MRQPAENEGNTPQRLSGANLDEAFFRSEISANARLQVSDSNNQLASEYVNMVPWTTDNIAFTDANFKAMLLENYDANSDGEISAEEAAAAEAKFQAALKKNPKKKRPGGENRDIKCLSDHYAIQAFVTLK